MFFEKNQNIIQFPSMWNKLVNEQFKVTCLMLKCLSPVKRLQKIPWSIWLNQNCAQATHLCLKSPWRFLEKLFGVFPPDSDTSWHVSTYMVWTEYNYLKTFISPDHVISNFGHSHFFHNFCYKIWNELLFNLKEYRWGKCLT